MRTICHFVIVGILGLASIVSAHPGPLSGKLTAPDILRSRDEARRTARDWLMVLSHPAQAQLTPELDPEPIARITVDQDTLLAADDHFLDAVIGRDPDALIWFVKKAYDGEPRPLRVSLLSTRRESGWEVVEMDNWELTKRLFLLREQAAKKTELPLDAFFALWVPFAQNYYLGYFDQNQCWLVPALHDQYGVFGAGEPVPAETLLPYLRIVASQLNQQTVQ